MDAKYILLIQKQFDKPLSERETYELQGFLAGNEAAAKLCENVRRLIDDCENLELPDHLVPVNAEHLLASILSALTQTESRSWFSSVKEFVKGKKEKSQISSAHQDELAVLRKHKATAERNSKAMDSLRAKVMAEVAPVTPQDAVSLAEAIRRRMLSGQTEMEEQVQVEATTTFEVEQISAVPPIMTPEQFAPSSLPMQFNNAPPPSIAESMDQLFSSSNWPVITPDQIRASQEPEPTPDSAHWAQTSASQEPEEFKAAPGPSPIDSILKKRFLQQQQPTSETQREPMAPAGPPLSPFEPKPWSTDEEPWPAIGATAPPQLLRPASLIPVDDIIAHVSQMFSEHIPNEAPKAVSQGEGSDSSGSYPQIREIDLRQARAARLANTSAVDETNGHIKTLSKFLLDQTSEAAISKLATQNANLSHARILSDEEAKALQDCLSPIESLQGVAGCIIIGYDGMIITSSLPEHADKDALSAWALLTYMNTHDLVRVIGHNRLKQFVSRTQSGYLLLADFGQGLLLAVSDNASTEAILPLMKSVRRVTAA